MTDFSNSCFCVTPKNQALHEPSPVFHKATCIWKFVQRQLPHLGFRWRYRRILFGYQARIFQFLFFNVSHKNLSFMTWNLIEYLHAQDFQTATADLSEHFIVLLRVCLYTTHNILTESKRRKLVFRLRSTRHFKSFLLT